MGVVLTAARKFTSLCLPEGGCEEEEEEEEEGGRRERSRKHFVEMLAEILLSFTRDPRQFTKFTVSSEAFDSNTDSTESLENILGIYILVFS